MPDRPGDGPFRWILDPIDGTKSFIHGVPLYGTLVGIEHEGEPVAGVIRIPALDECVYAAARTGGLVSTRRPSRPGRPGSRRARQLSEGLFLTSEVATFDEIGRRDVYDRLQAAARLSRSWGDCYGYLMVATGRAEVMVDPVAAVWDLAAAVADPGRGRRHLHRLAGPPHDPLRPGHRHQRPSARGGAGEA